MTDILLRRTRPETCLSDRELDRLRVDELAEAPRRAALEHLGSCECCRARKIELDRAFEQDLEALPTWVPPRRVANTWPRMVVAGLGALAAVGLAWLVATRDVERSSETQLKGAGALGGAGLEVYVQRDGVVVPWSRLPALQPGDELGFSYSLLVPRDLAILGRDGAGVVTTYFPVGGRTLRLEPGEQVPVGDAIRLDETLGEEAVFALLCTTPVEIEVLRAAIAASPDAPRVPSECALQTWTAEKTKATP